MYYDFFGFREAPFSIAPDPRYLYLSERHKEALAHLMYGVRGQGGFIVVTGEVGTGKTTVCRCFLEQAPANADIALILNPKLSARELLATICDELGIRQPAGASIKRMIDQLNAHLMQAYAEGRHTVVIIDEAQNLSSDVLEQLRLLTNLETAEKKLLQIVLLGQPELQDMLARQEMRQLAQRITARYHLEPLGRDEIGAYIRYRMTVAGQGGDIFTPGALRCLYRLGQGIPRLINLIGDRALLGAYAEGEHRVDAATVKAAAREVKGGLRATGVQAGKGSGPRVRPGFLASVAVFLALLALLLTAYQQKLFPKAALENARAAMSGHSGHVVRSDRPISVQPDSRTVSAPSANDPVPASAAGEHYSDFDLDSFKPSGNSKVHAYQALFHRWGHEYRPEASPLACNFALSVGLECLHRQGNWHSLVRMDRPAILRLFGKNGDVIYATLISLSGNHGVLDIDDHRVDLPLRIIQSHWLGEYSLLWKTPPFMDGTTGTVDKARKNAWLRGRLAALIGQAEPDQAKAVSLEKRPLSDQIKWFQQRHGLIPDGIPGKVTLIQMNSQLGIRSPRLTKQPTGAGQIGAGG